MKNSAFNARPSARRVTIRIRTNANVLLFSLLLPIMGRSKVGAAADWGVVDVGAELRIDR
ncbi:MAG: hypothetical protein O3C21_06220 [Verrucomicrobia bacterium]|nr:hypothetical protein [Verrucomicrobiota bacterium]